MMFRTWLKQTDPYYVVTAQLSKRDLRGRTCGILAALGLAVAALNSASLVSSEPSTVIAHWVVAAALMTCAAACAVFWVRRHRWPSQLGSYATVLLATSCTTASCLSFGQPILGVLSGVTFAMIAGYIGIFHHPAALVVPWTALAVCLVILCRHVDGSDAVATGFGAALILVVNAGAFFTTWTAGRLWNATEQPKHLEPLTGLLNEDGFYMDTSTLIGSRNRLEDQYLTITSVSIDNYFAILDVEGATAAASTRSGVGRAVAETLRHDAIVAHACHDEFLIAEVFDDPDPSPLVERIRGAVNTVRPRSTASIGTVSRPLLVVAEHPPYEAIDALIARARTAALVARSAGGNRPQYDIGEEFKLRHASD